MGVDTNLGTRGLNVLLVEDDDLYAQVLQANLESVAPGQFNWTRGVTLEESLQRLDGGKFDVILLDLSLPDSYGLDTFHDIQKKAGLIPIVILTGVEDENQALAAVRRGAQEYLVKGQVSGKMLWRMLRYAIERKQVERNLQEREEFFRLISENMTDLIAVLDKDGKRLYNSPSYRNLLGDPNQLRGTNSFIEIHPEDQEKVRRIFQQTIETGVGRRTGYRFLLGDGTVRYVESVGSVIRDEEGRPNKVVVVSRDMTEQREAIERIRHSEALYHSLVEHLPQNLFRKDLHGRFTFANQQFCHSLRQPLEGILGKNDFDFFPPELARKYQADDRRVIETGQTLEMVEENQPVGGERLDVQIVKIPICDSRGMITGIQGMFWDITKQKRSEESLRKALEELKKSHQELQAAQLQLIQAAKLESVGALAAGVAHEVKNPLQTILMGLHYLSKNVPLENENIQLALTDMHSAVKRADMIIRGLLHFSSAQETALKEENLNAVIAQALLLVYYEITKAKVTLRGDLDPKVPQVRLDKTKIEQVFINLIMNALHAMPGGGVLTIRTRVDRAGSLPELPASPLLDPDQPIVLAEVLDTGQGIPEHVLPRVFDPFFTTKPIGVGTGLGLPISKKIIELHGGGISLRNNPGGGARATIALRVPLTGAI